MILYKSQNLIQGEDLSSSVVLATIKSRESITALGSINSIELLEKNDTIGLQSIDQVISNIQALALDHRPTKVCLALDTDLFTLVPYELYDPDEDITYFRNLGYLTYNDQIMSMDLPELKSKYLFAAPRATIEGIQQELPDAYIFPYGYVLLKHFLKLREKESIDTGMITYIDQAYFYLTIFKGSKLHYFNKIDISTREDFLYHILLRYTHFEMNIISDPLILCGGISLDGDITKLISQYIGEVTMVDIAWDQYIKDIDSLENPQYYQDIYALSECA